MKEWEDIIRVLDTMNLILDRIDYALSLKDVTIANGSAVSSTFPNFLSGYRMSILNKKPLGIGSRSIENDLFNGITDIYSDSSTDSINTTPVSVNSIGRMSGLGYVSVSSVGKVSAGNSVDNINRAANIAQTLLIKKPMPLMVHFVSTPTFTGLSEGAITKTIEVGGVNPIIPQSPGNIISDSTGNSTMPINQYGSDITHKSVFSPASSISALSDNKLRKSSDVQFTHKKGIRSLEETHSNGQAFHNKQESYISTQNHENNIYIPEHSLENQLVDIFRQINTELL